MVLHLYNICLKLSTESEIIVSLLLKSKRLVVGNTKEFINGSALSHEGHTHSANDITNGVLPVSRGGTGTDSIANFKSMLGLSNINLEKSFISSLTKTYGPYNKTYTSYNGYENIMMSLQVPGGLSDISFLIFEFDFTLTVRSDGICRMYYDNGAQEYVNLDINLAAYYNYPADKLGTTDGLYIPKYVSNVFWNIYNARLTTSTPITRHNVVAKTFTGNPNITYLNPVIQIHTVNQAYYTDLYVDLSYNAYLIGIK